MHHRSPCYYLIVKTDLHIYTCKEDFEIVHQVIVVGGVLLVKLQFFSTNGWDDTTICEMFVVKQDDVHTFVAI